MPNEQPTIAHIIQIDDAWLPKVKEYNFKLEDLDKEDSNRDEVGTMHRSVLRSGVFRADVVHICTLEEMVTICSAVKGNAQISVTVLAPGKTANSAYSAITAYVSKIETKLIWYEDPESEDGYSSWWEVRYSLVEV